MNVRQKRLLQLIDQHSRQDGTDRQGALRDILTDIFHVSEEVGLDIDKAIDGALEVFIEERIEAQENEVSNSTDTEG